MLKKLDIRKLSLSLHSDWMIVQWYGLMGEWLSQWSAKPFTAVRIRFRPPERYLFGNAFFCCLPCPLVGLYPVFGIAQGLRPSSARYYALRCKHHSTISCSRCSAVRAMPFAATIPTHNEPTTQYRRTTYQSALLTFGVRLRG